MHWARCKCKCNGPLNRHRSYDALYINMLQTVFDGQGCYTIWWIAKRETASPPHSDYRFTQLVHLREYITHTPRATERSGSQRSEANSEAKPSQAGCKIEITNAEQIYGQRELGTAEICREWSPIAHLPTAIDAIVALSMRIVTQASFMFTERKEEYIFNDINLLLNHIFNLTKT